MLSFPWLLTYKNIRLQLLVAILSQRGESVPLNKANKRKVRPKDGDISSYII